LVGDAPAVDLDAAITQGRKLAAHTGARVLVKGGHLTGPSSSGPAGATQAGATRDRTAESVDALVDPDGSHMLIRGPRVDTNNTHGTGCSLSSALAALRPQRDSWAQAAIEAKAWLSGALAASGLLDVGTGAGPIHHLHHLVPVRSDPPFSASMWQRIAPIREAIETMPFIRDLAGGDLPWPNFRFYLAQDAYYLRDYARCLARVAALAPEQDAQEFFAHASAGALEAEMSLHRSMLAEHGESLDGVQVSPITAGYVDHLHRACAGGDYPQAVAAVLPCFWLYQYIGRLLAETFPTALAGQHPYAAWIATYADPAFEELTTAAIGFTDRAAAGASERQRRVMATAFERSSQYEWMFFAQGSDMPGWPV